MIVALSAEAETDIEAIADYIAKDSKRRAISFVRELRERCMSLGEFPLRFPLVPRYEERGVRRRVYGNYLIFYRVEPDRVVVIHVLHGAMNYAELLFPDEPSG
jgi:toxin ParE1/3/4